MLTATYSLIAISNEQNALRRLLHKARQGIRSACENLQQVDCSALKAVFDQLMQFDALCHARKVERYLIPAIRTVTRTADNLLAELDMLSAAGMQLLRSAGDILSRRLPDGRQVMEAHGSLDLYCRKMTIRLAKEEAALFPLAQQVFSVEDWFSIAEKFLSDDKRALKRQRAATHFIAAPVIASRLTAH